MKCRRRSAARTSIKINCPFCGSDFEPEDILFCDTISGKVSDINAYDSVYAGFLEHIIAFTRANATIPGGKTVEMEERDKYYFHPWSNKNRSGALPFHKPIHIEFGRSPLYPAKITVNRNHGLTPRMELNGSQPYDQIPGPDASAFENDVTNGQFRGMDAHQEDEDTPHFDGDVIKTLTTKACPHCHCYLPDDIGCFPLHRVVMLGSTRAGKTTYMTMAAHQAITGIGLPSGLMRCNISAESKRYFDYLIRCMENGALPSTVLDIANNVRVVFPLLLTVTRQDTDESFFLSIHDCPGEAMQNPDYLVNFPALGTAEGAIMVLDPNQFLQNNALRDTIAKADTCTETFNGTLALFLRYLPFFRNLRQLIYTLAKIDLIYGTEEEKKIHPKEYSCLDNPNFLEQHANAVDLEWIRNMSIQVSGVIMKQLNFKDYTNRSSDVTRILRNLEVTTLCCSTQSWNEGTCSFVPVLDRRNDIIAVNMTGYRILEPLLCILAKCNLLPVKSNGLRRD
jgi:hypothetical protein